MLRQLHIANLAVIEDAAIDLREGLNCFTGQTGAGKSLVIGAFELLLGLRSAADLLRGGAEEGRVSGVFELTDPDTIRRIAELGDLTPGSDIVDDQGRAQVLITRKLFSSGRTSVSINGQPATASMLRAIGELLVDVHGQHDHQYLLKPANQLEMLDRFGDCEELRERFADAARRLRELRHRRDELHASETLRRQQLELYEFQAGEIDAVEPTPGEYAELAARHRLLSNLGRVQSEAGGVYAALYESEGSAAERLAAMVGVLRELAELDSELAPVAEAVAAAAAQVNDAAYDLGRYINRIDLDAGELSEVTDRLDALNRLIHKYGTTSPRAGGSLDDVLAHRRRLADDITRLRGEGEDLASIDGQIDPLAAELAAIGAELTKRRKAAAKKLCPQIEAQLAELGMAEAKFDVSIDPLDGAAAGESVGGLDAVEMMVRTNPGQPERPMRKIASGGEMSRIMLAVKSILADADRVSVLVFDEIDANIGGRMGSVIGQKMRRLAAGHQVLCITHLPQIAAWADHHVRITKEVAGGSARTRVEPLTSRDERVEELSQMLGGSNATPATRRNAEEMLALAAADGALDRARTKRDAPRDTSAKRVKATVSTTRGARADGRRMKKF